MRGKKIIGIAGYVASGKTEAGRFLAGLGAGFIEADDVVNGLYRPSGDGYRKIASYFGHEYLKKNGEINRRKLAKFAFGDKNKLKILNALIHPLVANEIRKIIDKSKEKLIVIEAAYFERGRLLDMVDKIIWVDCKKEILRKRAIKNNGITERMFEQIIDAQVKPEKVDFVVKNNGGKGELHQRLNKIYGILSVGL